MAGEYDAAIQLLIKAQDQTGPAFSSLQGNLGKTTSGINLASVATSVFSGVAVSQMIGALQTAGRAANEHQLALTALSTAVDNNGGSWAASRKQIEANIAANRRFGFSDKDLMDSLTLLTVESGSWSEALDRQRVAMDLARGTGMDLYTASRLLGKVTDENVTVLKRWGITVEKGASEAELFAEVEKRVGNAAENAAKTQAVQGQVLANTITNIEASIGSQAGVIQSLAAVGPIAKTGFGVLTGALVLLTSTMDKGSVSSARFKALLSSMGDGLPSLAGRLGLVAAGAAEFFGIIEGAAILGRAGVPVLDQFANKEGTGSLDLLGKIVEKRGVVGALGLIKDAILGIKEAAHPAADEMAKLNAKLITLGNTYGSFLAGGLGKGAPGGLARAGASAAGIVKDIADSLKLGTDDPALKQIEDIMNNVVGLTPAGAFKEMGDQLYKRVHDKIQGELVDPLLKIKEEISAPGKAGADALADYAKQAGKSPAQYLKDLTTEIADAEKRVADSDAIVKGLLAKTNADASVALKTFHDEQRARLEDEKIAVMDLKDEYERLNGARIPPAKGTTTRDTYLAQGFGSPFAGLFTGRALGGPMLPGNLYEVGEQNRREAIVKGVGADRSRDATGSGVTIMPGAIALHYAGSADRAAATRLGADIVDTVTEALRQQSRRVGRRLSPFGAV